VSNGCVDIVIDGVSTVNHEAVHKLHGLGSLSSQLARDNHFTALGSRLHDEPKHTIAGPAGKQFNHKQGSYKKSKQTLVMLVKRISTCSTYINSYNTDFHFCKVKTQLFKSEMIHTHYNFIKRSSIKVF